MERERRYGYRKGDDIVSHKSPTLSGEAVKLLEKVLESATMTQLENI